jgi:hypothetical protein
VEDHLLSIKKLRVPLEEQPYPTTRELAATLQPSQRTINRHLHLTDFTRENSHELIDAQAQGRVDICATLLQHLTKSGSFLLILIEKPNRLLKIESHNHEFVKIVLKVMLSVWLIFEGVLHFEMIPKSALYCQQLDRVYAATPEKYPAMIERMRILLQRDNALCNRAV